MIHIVIPVHNRIKFTKKCIRSIYNQKTTRKLKIIIVDDASTDGTYKFIKKNFPRIKILKGSGFLFWGGAVRLGINYIKNNSKKKDWVLLVNNDVELAENTIEQMISLANKYKRKALVSALSLSLKDKNTIIKSGTIVESWVLNKTKHIFKGKKINQLEKKYPVEVDIFTGRCLLHPIEIFKNIGNYNSKTFPHYGGDDEFSLRAKRKGYKNLLCLKSHVFLNEQKFKNIGRNKLKYLKFLMFDKKSSSNIFDKFNFTIKAVPIYAKFSFFLIGLVKTFYIFIKNDQI